MMDTQTVLNDGLSTMQAEYTILYMAVILLLLVGVALFLGIRFVLGIYKKGREDNNQSKTDFVQPITNEINLLNKTLLSVAATLKANTLVVLSLKEIIQAHEYTVHGVNESVFNEQGREVLKNKMQTFIDTNEDIKKQIKEL